MPEFPVALRFSCIQAFLMIRLSLFQPLYILLLLSLSQAASAKDYSKLFEKLSRTVVTLHTVETSVTANAGGIQQTTAQGLGSGVLIDADGTILTAAHVVDNASQISVELRDGRRLPAFVVSTVKVADLAVVRILMAPDDLKFVKPGNSDKVAIGEEVFVIGAPYGLKHTFTAGNLSGRRVTESAYFGDDLEMLQTDAPINQGNSGGPLFSSRGELIGIVSHIKTKSGGSEGLGFAASINMARDLILNQPPLWFGMEFITVNEASLRMLNVADYNFGLLVQRVAEGSLGAKFGIRPGSFPITVQDQPMLLGGDIVVEAGGFRFGGSIEQLRIVKDYFEQTPAGELLNLTVVREGQKLQLSAVKPDIR